MARLIIVIFIFKILNCSLEFLEADIRYNLTLLLGLYTYGRKREEAVLVRGRRKAMIPSLTHPGSELPSDYCPTGVLVLC